ncbi:MAG: hypothetical protein ACRDP7_50350 [Trebonia sp.]
MSHLITTQQSAAVIQSALGPGAPDITRDKVSRLIATGVLHNFSSTKWAMLDYGAVASLAQGTRYAPRASFPYERAMRVSVGPLEDDPITLPSGQQWRLYKGIDHANSRNLSPQDVLNAWTGVWPVSAARANSVIGCPLLASNWGFVHPDFCRVITGWRPWPDPKSNTVLFDTRPDPKLAAVIGTGIWIDVPKGPIADLL